MPLGSCERFTTVRTRVNASTLIDTDIRRLHLPSMTHRLEFVETIHDRAAVRKLLFDYYTDILPRGFNSPVQHAGYGLGIAGLAS